MDAGDPTYEAGSPLAISKLIETMTLEESNMVPDTVNFVETELLLCGEVLPETKGNGVKFSKRPDRCMGTWPLPTLLGVGSLKTREPKAAHGMYLFTSWRT